VLEMLSRVILLYDYYCIVNRSEATICLDAQRGALGGPLSGGKRDGLAWA
jgi:hypothetical protein